MSRALRLLRSSSPIMALVVLAWTAASYCWLAPQLRAPGTVAPAWVIVLVLCKNVGACVIVYGGLELLYGRVRPWHRRRFADRAPGPVQAARDARRTLVSVLVGSGYELALSCALGLGWLTMEPSTPALPGLLFGALALLVWGDLHFLLGHRMLHGPWLMRHVHGIHHQSHNPTPVSGLAFHPLEAVIYYSALLLPVVVPVSVVHWLLLKAGLDLIPAFGHLGHGGWAGGSRYHYLHHARGRGNYGATPTWERLWVRLSTALAQRRR